MRTKRFSCEPTHRKISATASFESEGREEMTAMRRHFARVQEVHENNVIGTARRRLPRDAACGRRRVLGVARPMQARKVRPTIEWRRRSR